MESIGPVNLQNWSYQTKKTLLVPYQANQKNFFPETFVGGLYLKVKEQGLLETVYPGSDQMDYNKFIAYMKDKPTVLYIMKPADVVGFGWIIENEGRDGYRRASFGFTVFREAWGRQETRDLIWMCLGWWMFELGIESLYGVTLRSNSLARNFSRNFGFQELCVLPKFFLVNHKLADARLVFLDRETFQPLYHSWRQSQESQETHALTVH